MNPVVRLLKDPPRITITFLESGDEVCFSIHEGKKWSKLGPRSRRNLASPSGKKEIAEGVVAEARVIAQGTLKKLRSPEPPIVYQGVVIGRER